MATIFDSALGRMRQSDVPSVTTNTSAGLVPNPGGVGATYYLNATGAFSVPTGNRENLTTTQIANLTTTHMAVLSTTALGGLTSTQLGSLTTNFPKVTATSAGLVPNPNNVDATNYLNATGAFSVPTGNRENLTTTQIANLTTTHMAVLSTTALGGLTSTQLGSLTTNFPKVTATSAGLVPNPGGVGATNYLNATGAFSVPTGAELPTTISRTNVAETRTASIDMADNTVQRPKLKDWSETETAPTSSGGVITLDMELSNVFSTTLTENITTLSITNPPATGAGSLTWVLTQNSTPRTVAWPASVRWTNGVTPSITQASSIHVLAFVTLDAGITWYGFQSGKNMKVSA